MSHIQHQPSLKVIVFVEHGCLYKSKFKGQLAQLGGSNWWGWKLGRAGRYDHRGWRSRKKEMRKQDSMVKADFFLLARCEKGWIRRGKVGSKIGHGGNRTGSKGQPQVFDGGKELRCKLKANEAAVFHVPTFCTSSLKGKSQKNVALPKWSIGMFLMSEIHAHTHSRYTR